MLMRLAVIPAIFWVLMDTRMLLLMWNAQHVKWTA